jgi:uracil-DNA glycosylase family 4
MKPKAPFAKCNECPLQDMPFVPSVGPRHVDLIVVGEAPGYQEVKEQEPFVGPSGKLLKAVVEQEGGSYDRIFRTNTVLCRPPGNKTPEPEAIEACASRLQHEIASVECETVVGLGKTANQALNPLFDTGMRGKWVEQNGKRIIGTWHPAYVLRKPSEAGALIKDVSKALSGYTPPRFVEPPRAIWIHEVSKLREYLAFVPENARLSYDLETDNVMWYNRPGQRADAVLMMLMAWCDDFGIVLNDVMLYDTPGVAETLQNFFNERRDVTFVTQNGKFDQVFLRSHFGIRAPNDFDVFLAHYTLDENSLHGLKVLAAEEFEMEDYEKELVQKYLKSRNDSYSKVPEQQLAQYGVYDVVVTRALSEVFEKRLRRKGLWEWPFQNVLMRASNALVEIELLGIQVDIPHLQTWDTRMSTEMTMLEKRAAAMIGREINLNSPQQVAVVLYDEKGFPAAKMRGVGPRSTARGVVEKYITKDPFVDLLIYYRRIQKLRSSYLQNMIEYADTSGRIHPSFWLPGTEIGRISVRDPAMQTVPRPGEKIDVPSGWIYENSVLMDGAIIRGAVIPAPGNILADADYSQAEMRVAAYLSKDPFLLRVYQEDRDLHSEVAIAMYGENFTHEQRVRTKMFNFSYLYGGNEYSFAMDAGLPIAVARKFVRDYNRVMARLYQFRKDQYALLKEQGYVETLFGRRRRFPFITNKNADEARKASLHMPVAGTASDITLLSACRLVEEGQPVILMVHDSVMADTRDRGLVEYTKQVMLETAQKYIPEVPWKVDSKPKERWATPPEWVPVQEV